MRIIVQLDWLFAEEVGTSVISRLHEVMPEQQESNHSFTMTVPDGDPRLGRVLSVLADAGLVRGTDRFRVRDRTREYALRYRREYDDSDLRLCELLELLPTGHVYRQSHGVLPHSIGLGVPEDLYGFQAEYINPDIDFGHIGSGCPVFVPGRVARVLEHADLQGLTFRRVVLQVLQWHSNEVGYHDVPWDTYGEPWRQICAGPEMPPVSPYLKRCHGATGAPVPRESRGGIIIEEGFADRELHYLRSEVSRMPAFDIARLFESGGEGPFVVSRKFYDVCQQHGLRCGWRPVRIDED